MLSGALCRGKNAVLEDLSTHELFVRRAKRGAFDHRGVLLCADRDRARPIRGIELSESFRQPVQRTAYEMDVIGMPEILSQCGGRRESFEILGEDLAPAAAPFPVLHRVEEGFQLIVGARHQTKSSSRPPRNPDSVPPQMGAVTFEVPEDQVDGLPPVGSGTALGAFSAERRCEALGGGLHIPELLDRGVLLFEPEGGPKPIKQIGSFDLRHLRRKRREVGPL